LGRIDISPLSLLSLSLFSPPFPPSPLPSSFPPSFTLSTLKTVRGGKEMEEREVFRSDSACVVEYILKIDPK
jgi:hypothetical protein